MNVEQHLFARFGGTRPMARELGMRPSTIHAWKKTRRIPAEHQRHVLQRAGELGLDVTVEDIMFPFPEDRVAR